MANLIPILRYRDPLMAIEWLGETLGFIRHFVAEEGGCIVHAQMRLGDALLMLGPDHSDDRYGMHSPLALTGTSQCVYIALDDDVDDAYDKAKMAGAEIVTEPYDTPYGSREFTCRDPEGHIWSVGSYAGEPIASSR
jgi:uncharacterized glyoxalase superfamily protein PhnB